MTELGRRELLRWLGGAGFALGAGARVSARESMLERVVPASGERLPVVGLGTYRTFDLRPGEPRAPLAEVLARFVELGGQVVDSSPMYGRAERVLGELAAELGIGDRLFVATKVWTRGRQSGIEQMRRSMELLGADPLDLMQIHNLVDWRTHLDTLRAWRHEGRIRYLGVTHYTAGAYDALAEVMRGEPLDFVQINYSVVETEAERRILPIAAERGIAVIVNRPFAGGGLFRRTRDRALPALARELGCESWAQLFLKFILGHPAVTCVIPATSKPKHLVDNMGAGHGPLPDAGARERIVDLVRELG